MHTAVHTHTAVTMLSAQRTSSAVYTPAFTCDGRDLYRAGGLEDMEVVWQVRTRTHSQVMKRICYAGAQEEGEVVWQVRARTRILHTQTHRSTVALHTYVPHR